MTATATAPYVPCANVFQRISSFEKKPASGGRPAMAIVPIRNVQNVTGSALRRPPMLRRSCSPASA